MSTCNACKSVFTTFEYQTRSADEAHTVVTTCPNCPVNANKLNSSAMPLPSFRGLVRPVNRRSLQTEPCRSRSHNKFYTLSFDIPQDHEYYDMELESDCIVKRMSLHRRSVSDTSVSYATEIHYVVKGINQDLCTSLNSTSSMGIGIRMCTHDIYDVSDDIRSPSLCKGKFHQVDIVNGYKCIVQHMFNDNRKTLEVELGNNIPRDQTMESIARQVYSAGVYPSNIRMYLGNDRISRFSNLSARAWDTNVPPTSDHVFTSKPDGQRMWMVWSGHIWYICNPRFTGSTGRWLWSNRTRHTDDILVADVEYVLSRGFILIDFLTSMDGTDAPVVRDLTWVLSQYNVLQTYLSDVPFYPRQYFDTNDGALQYSKNMLLPCDGTIAMRNDSTEILKIKSVKSLELTIMEDKTLVTSNDTIVMRCPDIYTFDTGDIVEIRFTMSKDMHSIVVSDMFKRVDKFMANDDTAVSNIIQSSVISTTPADNERRVALLWCNELRRSLQQNAIESRPTKSIILDIGTGNGQSLDAMLRNDKVSYVLIEPDTRSCAALARRLGIKKVFTDPREIIPMIRSLKTRSIQYIILNCRLQDLIDHRNVCETLMSEVKCITATFSAHYIVQELHDIVDSFNIPVYACTYVYDNTINTILINDCGVSMRTVDNETAEVRWGGDKVYTEPITYMRDYTGIGVNIYAEQYKQLPAIGSTPGAHNICRNVMLISP